MPDDDIQRRLREHGITASDETTLREMLEQHIETYTLFKLAPWPARRWKCHYRLMSRDQTYDGKSAAEAYALALLGQLEQ